MVLPISQDLQLMSTHILKIIPNEPNYEPTKYQQDEVLKYLKIKYSNHEISADLSREVNFIDQGENFDTVSCSHCRTELDIKFWQERMDEAYKTNFKDLNFISECCTKETSLNDLFYDMPAGFSKYIIAVTNPDYEDLTNSEFILGIESILKKKVRIIWAHY